MTHPVHRDSPAPRVRLLPPVSEARPGGGRPDGGHPDDPLSDGEGRGARDEGSSTTVVRPWFDPDLALRGVDPRSSYVEQFWLGVAGPSVVLLVRRLARGLQLHPAGFSMDLSETARALGLGAGTSRNSAIVRTIDRAAMFGMLRRNGPDGLDVRTHLPVLTRRQLQRLPAVLRRSHDSWAAAGGPRPGDAA